MLSPAGSYLLLLCGLLKHRNPLCGYTKEGCRAWHPTKGMASQENVLYMYFLTRLPFPDPGWEKLSSTSCLSTRAEICSRRAPAQGLPAQSVVVCGKPGEIRVFICQAPRWAFSTRLEACSRTNSTEDCSSVHLGWESCFQELCATRRQDSHRADTPASGLALPGYAVS